MDRIEVVKNVIKSRAQGLKIPKIGKKDALAAVTTGVANIPDGMASAVLAGVNPIHGVYTLIIGTPVAALSTSTKLMMFNTTSAMTLIAVDGLGVRQGDERVAALMTIALVAGVFQLVLGTLGLGMMTKFVSHSVMIGFLTGISVSIIMGQLWDLTGYEGEGGGRLEKTAQLLSNLRDVDIATTLVGIGSLALMFLLVRTRFGAYNLLIVLAAATAIIWVLNPDSIVLVSSLGEIPQTLPPFELPSLKLIPTMLLTGIAVGAVGLLQAAGVAQAYPNSDGTDTDDSRDFIGQGAANIASSCFQGMAGGGSLSGTAMNVSAGAQSRWANVIQAGVVLVMVLLLGGVLSQIPMAGLAALLVYSAVLSIRIPAISTVGRTSKSSLAGMLTTFLATLVMPLQQAVMVGIALAAVLFLYRASIDIKLKQVRIVRDRLVVSDPPKELPGNAVTVLDVHGNLFYAGARTLAELLPAPSDAGHSGVILRLRDQTDIGSTFFKVVGKYAADLRKSGGVLLLAGVEPGVKERMKRADLLDSIGEENIFLSGNVIGESTSDALRAGEDWLNAHPGDMPSRPSSRSVESDATLISLPTSISAPDNGANDNETVDVTSAPVGLHDWIKRYIPHLADISSRAVALAGAIFTVIGLLAILLTQAMLHLLMPLIGLMFLLVASFWWFVELGDSRGNRPADGVYRLLAAGVAVAVGVILSIQPLSGYVTLESAQVVLACGLALLGIIGLIPGYRGLTGKETRVSGITANLVLIILACLTLLTLERETSPIVLLGWLAVIAGIALLAYAVVLSRERASSGKNSPTDPVPHEPSEPRQ